MSREIFTADIGRQTVFVELSNEGEYSIHRIRREGKNLADTDHSYTSNKQMAAKKLGDFLFLAIDEVERERKKSVDAMDFIEPYVKMVEEACDKHGDTVLLDGNHPCGCAGPKGGEPLCPCAMQSMARLIVAEKRGYKFPK